MHYKKEEKTAKNKLLQFFKSEVLESSNGISRQVIVGSDEGPNFLMRRLVIEPEGGIPAHTSGTEHEQHVLGGTTRIEMGNQVYEVAKGDVVFIPSGSPHWYEAYGDEPFELLSILPNKDSEMVFIQNSPTGK